MDYSLLGGFRGGFLGREISVNISRITAFTNPESPAKRGHSILKIVVKLFALNLQISCNAVSCN